MAIKVLGQTQSVSSISREMEVSRKFLYAQAQKADQALTKAFEKIAKDDEVLFYLPVTPRWIKQMILALIFICHSSFRGVIELFRDLFDYTDISLGFIHNTVYEALSKAKTINATMDISFIKHPALDEIFQAGNPVLTGIDLDSTYCFLLSAEDHRDETSWGVHLLDLYDQGLHPEYSIADFGTGLRAGQTAAWKDVPCFGDIFHVTSEFKKLSTFLANRALKLMTASEKVEAKMDRARRNKKGQSFSKKLAYTRQSAENAIQLADDVTILLDWMQKDVFAFEGPSLSDRQGLFTFILNELRSRQPLCSHRISSVVTLLTNHQNDILGFAGVLDQKFAALSTQLQVHTDIIYAISKLQAIDNSTPQYWQEESKLKKQMGAKYHDLKNAILGEISKVHRASSMIENFNSRLRSYFFLRKQIGNDYLALLRFFLNHHRFLRSRCQERIGKSSAELMTGKTHSHWLDLLGFPLFKRT